MDERSRSREEILSELAARCAADHSYRRPGILGSMISQPHPLAEEVFARALETNVGDPGLFPGVAELEREVVAMLGALVGRPEATGNLVSGGSEANLLALWAARESAGRRGDRVIVPVTAHSSFEKAARLLGLELVSVPVGTRHRIDLEAVRAAVDARTIALVGIAGSTDVGAVDDVPGLAAIAREHGLPLHVDAAFGGFVLPFLAELGRPAPPFDFRVEGVSSITIDPHKMGLAVQPAGCVLFRDADAQAAIRTAIPYLAGGRSTQATVTGTRPGAAVCATWAVLRHLGREGYREIVRRCMDRTDRLVQLLGAVDGVAVRTPPEMNLVGIQPLETPVAELDRRLRSRGWALGVFRTHLRAVLLPHVTDGDLDRFLADLRLALRTPDPSRVPGC